MALKPGHLQVTSGNGLRRIGKTAIPFPPSELYHFGILISRYIRAKDEGQVGMEKRRGDREQPHVPALASRFL